MTGFDSFIPIIQSKVAVGKTAPWAIYDSWGNLLHPLGDIIENQAQLTNLIENGYYADAAWDSVTPTHTVHVAQNKLTQESTSSSSAVVKNSGHEQQKESIMLDLDGVRWHVGETFYLQVHDNSAVRYTVKLIGFVKNQSILVTAPLIDGKVALIRDGQTFIVRAFPGKNAYAFSSSALKSVFSPHPYLHLSYPKLVRCTTIRKNSRATVRIIASVTIGDPGETAAATLSDLSMGGTSGIIKKPLGKENDTGVIKFKVNVIDSDEFLVLNVVLRSITPAENSNEFRHGFEFFDVPAQSNLILSAFVHQTLAQIE
jgi:c-di-GMP-binding flagellar brake protein YcgR